MKRTSLMLPEDLKARAERRARQEGVSLGELIRRSLEERLEAGLPGEEEDPFFADAAVWSGPVERDLSRNHDHYLYDGAGHDGAGRGGVGHGGIDQDRPDRG